MGSDLARGTAKPRRTEKEHRFTTPTFVDTNVQCLQLRYCNDAHTQMKLLASLLLCTLATASNNVPLCGNEAAKISNYPYYGEEDIMDRPRYYRAFYADFQHTVTGTPRLGIAFHSDTGTVDPDISGQYECSATPTNATDVYEVHFAAGNLSWPQKNGKNLSITRLQYNATADRLVLDIFRNGTSLHMCLTQA